MPVHNTIVDPRNGNVIQYGNDRNSHDEQETGYYGDLYIEDERTGVSRGSLRKSRKFLFIGVLGMVAAIIAFIMCIVLYQTGITNHQNACWNHELQIEQLAQQYVTTNGFTSLPAYVEDIPTFENFDMQCPDGGTYTWNPVTGEYYCSVHQHYPDGYGKAQSTNLGTQTTVVENNTVS